MSVSLKKNINNYREYHDEDSESDPESSSRYESNSDSEEINIESKEKSPHNVDISFEKLKIKDKSNSNLNKSTYTKKIPSAKPITKSSTQHVIKTSAKPVIKTSEKSDSSSEESNDSSDEIIVDLSEINDFIEDGYCPEISFKIFNPNIEDMLEYPSVKKVKEKIKKIIISSLSSDINEEKCNNLIAKLTENFIPPGTKGVVRGNLFNKEIGFLLKTIILTNKNLRCEFEKDVEDHKLSEKPDWYIIDIKTKKKLIGFNQLDLWSGGHQTNRASKYVKNDDFHEKYKKYNIKIISIICTKIEISSRKNKVFTLFKEGIEKQRLFYPKQLCNFINKYFTS